MTTPLPGLSHYLADCAVDRAMDERIRALLTICFTKPQDVIFKTQRYFKEPYPHRWIITSPEGKLVAHVGVHEKQVISKGKTYRIGGIAEVCVHPDYRGHGAVKTMLREIHDWLKQRGYDYAMLFGDTRVYESSGYVTVRNLVYDEKGADGQIVRKPLLAMVKELTSTPWPHAEVYLPGPTF